MEEHGGGGQEYHAVGCFEGLSEELLVEEVILDQEHAEGLAIHV